MNIRFFNLTINVKDFLVTSLIFLTILNSGSLLVKSIGDDFFFLLEFLFSGIVYLKYSGILNFSFNQRIRFNSVHILLFYCLLSFHIISYMEAVNSYIGFMMRIASIYFLSEVISPYQFWSIYRKIIIWISSLSLVGMCLVNFFPSIISFLPIESLRLSYIINVFNDKISFNNIFIFTWPVHDSYFITRNQSIFWEPGAFQLFINLALISSLYYKNKFASKENILYFITVLTTLSTTGYIVLLLIYFQYFIKHFKINKKQMFINLWIIVLLVLIVFQSKIIQNKFSSNSFAYASFSRRLLDTSVDLLLIRDHWLFGYGFGDYASKIWAKKSLLLGGGTSSSNSLLLFLGQMGIIISLLYFSPLFKNRFLNSKILFFIILILWLSTENFTIQMIFIAIMYFPPENLKNKNITHNTVLLT